MHTHTVTIFLSLYRTGKNWCYTVKGKERTVFLNGMKIINVLLINICKIQELKISILSITVPQPSSAPRTESDHKLQKEEKNSFKMYLGGTKKYLF